MSRMSTEQRDLLYLFEKPYSPVYMPRAGNNVIYESPSQDVPPGVSIRFGGSSNNVIRFNTDQNTKTSVPAWVKAIPKGSFFSTNVRPHRQAAQEVINILNRATTVAQLRDFAASIKDDINENLFIYSLSFVINKNKLFRGVRVPSIFESFPSKTIPSNIMEAARVEVNQAVNNQNMDPNAPIVINHDQDFTGLRKRPENRVAYWREDYGLNAHHYHWHVIFPPDVMLTREQAPDRKGELFYYMHQQILARFDHERMSVGLPRVVKLDNFRAPIKDGYFPKLRFDNSELSRTPIPGLHPSATMWGNRQDNTLLQNYAREDTFDAVDINELELWRDRILDGIHRGHFVNSDGTQVPLSDEVDITDGTRRRGIDILGDTIEADSNLSINYQFYGDFHNFGHLLMASCHDPDGTHGENFGVIGDPATSLRDPVFYSFHKLIDWVFQKYKDTQPVYTVNQLQLEGVTVGRIGIATGTIADEIHTGWNYRQIEASRGIDFGTSRSVRVNLQHLDHKPFDLHVLAINATGRPKRVYVRIFYAPKFNQNGVEMRLDEQRLLFSELDKFVFTLQPGQNHIKRASTESSLTIPGEITFRELEQGVRFGNPADRDPADVQEDFCGCGWPQHLLVPRGRPEGMVYQLFVMMTDYEDDYVPSRSRGPNSCAKAHSFCGVLDDRYPDKRPMGFPFDRRHPRDLGNPDELVVFVTDFAKLSNMGVHDIAIRFLGDQLNPGANT